LRRPRSLKIDNVNSNCPEMSNIKLRYIWWQPSLFAEGAEAGAAAMVVGCRLAGLSTLEAHYAGINAFVQSGAGGR
jgi:hypothetical protein